MISERYLALFIFILTYIFFIIFPNKRMWTALSGSILLILLKIISVKEAFYSINWNVMGIFIGTLFIAELFMESKVPAYLAEVIIKRAKNTAWAILFICVLTGFISAFIENVATVLIVAPVAFSLSEKLKFDPTDMMIAIAISSNLQGCATLIGDPPSMLLAGFAKLNFIDFFIYKGKLSIFFAVEIGAIFSFFVLYLIFKKYKFKSKIRFQEKVNSWIPTYLVLGLIFALAFSSFSKFEYLPGIICMVFGIISLALNKVLYKKSMFETLKKLDWESFIFILCIFILVESLVKTGWILALADYLSKIIGNKIFFGYFLIIIISMFLSGFVDNVPFLVTMMPVIISISEKLNIQPYLYLFGLLIATSLGGNITPVGASANVVTYGLLKKRKANITFLKFVRIGLPFTIIAVLSGALFIWIIWK